MTARERGALFLAMVGFVIHEPTCPCLFVYVNQLSIEMYDGDLDRLSC